jgi:hypothetical protein
MSQVRWSKPLCKEMPNSLTLVMAVNGSIRSYESHFNDVTKEATTSGTKVGDPEIPRMMDKEDMDSENTIVEYNSNDVFINLN